MTEILLLGVGPPLTMVVLAPFRDTWEFCCLFQSSCISPTWQMSFFWTGLPAECLGSPKRSELEDPAGIKCGGCATGSLELTGLTDSFWSRSWWRCGQE